MSESTPEQRQNWRKFECAVDAMTTVAFGPDTIMVAPPTAEAWRALASVLAAHGYQIRTQDTDSYNCRKITGGSDRSLHAFGIALDINWTTNPYKKTPSKRTVNFSPKATQAERAEDVKRDLADTDMTPAMIADVLAIQTNGGARVFEWGGNWRKVKDAMHFEIDVTPEELAAGINWSTVKKAPSQADMQTAGGVGGSGGGDSIGQAAGAGGGTTLPPVDDARGSLDAVVEGLALGARGDAVAAVQQALTRLNYHLGAIDGVFGPLTQAMVLAFQADNKLPTTGVVDAETQAALLVAPPRPLSADRQFETVEDLREKGSKIIGLADWLKKLAVGTGVLGALGLSEGQVGLVSNIFGGLTGLPTTSPTSGGTPSATPPVAQPGTPPADAFGGIVDGLGPLLGVAKGLIGTQSGLGILAVGAGVLLWRNAQKITKQRLEEHKTGANLDK